MFIPCVDFTLIEERNLEYTAKMYNSSEETHGGIAVSGPACHKCKRPGHIARDCRSNGPPAFGGDSGPRRRNKEKCYKCNQFGHFARECKEEGDRCYRCKESGHIARDCSLPPEEPVCYVCNERGHFARNCPSQSESRQNMSCYNCNKSGHISRNCPDAIKTCYVCGEAGHISRDCKNNGGRN